MTEDQIRNLFVYHTPEQTHAIRAIADARMRMNQAVAMHGVNDEDK